MFPKPIRQKNKELLKTYHSMRCIVSGIAGAEPHHLITVKAGGPDEEWNLMPLIRRLHTECHQIGLNKFTQKYKKAQVWLISHGWTFDLNKNKWIRPSFLDKPDIPE